MYVKDQADSSQVPGSPFGCTDEDFGAMYPALWEYLSLREFPSGKPRETSSLTIFVEGGLVKACLNDRHMARTGWMSGRTVADLLTALDGALQEDMLDWRKQQPRVAKGKT